MQRTVNNSVCRAVVKAYKENISLPDISKVFSVDYETIVRIVYLNQCKGVQYEC